MPTSLLPTPERTDLVSLSLKDCPDLVTAVAAGEAHGLSPRDALKAAFMKWANDNAESVQRYGIANFYDGIDQPRAMMNYTGLIQFLTIIVAEQGRAIATQQQQIDTLQNERLQAGG